MSSSIISPEDEIAAGLNRRPGDGTAATPAAGAAAVGPAAGPTAAGPPADAEPESRPPGQADARSARDPAQPRRAALALHALEAATGPAGTASPATQGPARSLAVADPVQGTDTAAEVPAGLAAVAEAGRKVTDWASSRSLGSSSAGGISLALALCAAGWFTAGTRSDNFRAVAALWTAYLAMVAARSLATGPDHDQLQARGTVVAGPNAVARTRWLAVLSWGASESACYAGLAAGAAAQRWAGVWPLAIGVLSLIGVRDLITACSRPGKNPLAQGGTTWRTVNLFLSMPAGGRVLLIGIVAPAWGSRAALFVLLDWAIIAVGYGLAAQAGSSARAQAVASQRRAPDRAPWPGSLVILLSPSGQDLADLDQDEIESAVPVPAGYGRTPSQLADAALDPRDSAPAVLMPAAGPDGADGDRPAADPDSTGGTGPAAKPAAGPADRPAAVPRHVRLRDDGELARRLGKPVRGNLLPLPPAVLGLAATATLAYLGLRSLPGVLILAPVLIMLLVAAPGSSNKHSGRLDWLVPAVLLGWQFLYVAAVGQAVAVPGPVTFLLCTALLLRYADLAFPGRPVMLARRVLAAEPFRERGTALGWDGRMLLVGIGAAIGIGTFAYLALTAYLVLLLGAKVLTSCPWLKEVDGR